MYNTALSDFLKEMKTHFKISCTVCTRNIRVIKLNKK